MEMLKMQMDVPKSRAVRLIYRLDRAVHTTQRCSVWITRRGRSLATAKVLYPLGSCLLRVCGSLDDHISISAYKG